MRGWEGVQRAWRASLVSCLTFGKGWAVLQLLCLSACSLSLTRSVTHFFYLLSGSPVWPHCFRPASVCRRRAVWRRS